ncbi:hypothetical protein IAQ61_001529 [Plenodomus lingam]|uniref:uncharacterized protein n=1 Tax=Leptosphaeria maculans TaxID=5022 RepID=UPI0033285AC1|nr:hypothetical protein IAQ61_001529 [Plenodomus lingam]
MLAAVHPAITCQVVSNQWGITGGTGRQGVHEAKVYMEHNASACPNTSQKKHGTNKPSLQQQRAPLTSWGQARMQFTSQWEARAIVSETVASCLPIDNGA